MKDLHIKTSFSAGGQDFVEDILRKAESEGMKAISITDHNTALSHVVIKHINAKKLFSGKIVSGIEIDVCKDGITFEILGYGFDVDKVQTWAYSKFATLDVRQTKLRNRLMVLAEKRGFKLQSNFKWDAKSEYAHFNVFNNIMQFEENLKLFNKPTPDGSEFYRLSTTDKEYVLYLDMSFLWAELEETIEVLHQNGGRAVLAHPFKYTKDLDVGSLLEMCVRAGIDGVEVYHPKHTKEQIEFLLEYCNKHKLYVTGGSAYIRKENEEKTNFARLDSEITLPL